jgi:hypothetical protein
MSSGGDYLHLNTHAYYNGTAWIGDGTAGVLFQGSGQTFNWYKGTASTTPSYTALLALDATGNLTATANVTAYSDETLKTNWRPMPTDFVERLAQVKSGTYDRLDEEITQDGVGAQSLQPLMPNSVLTQKEGKLSVAYGNAAMVSAVELAKRVVDQEIRIARLEAIIEGLSK